MKKIILFVVSFWCIFALAASGSINLFGYGGSSGGGGSPGGSTNSVQTNNGSGGFGGDTNFKYDGTSIIVDKPIISPSGTNHSLIMVQDGTGKIQLGSSSPTLAAFVFDPTSGGTINLTPNATHNSGSAVSAYTALFNIYPDNDTAGSVVPKLELWNIAETHGVTLTIPSGLAADPVFTLPGTAGSSGQVLKTDGATPALLSWGTVGIAAGGTGQTTKAAAFDALQPMTTSGDIIYGGASGTGTRLPKGADGNCLTQASGIPAWGSCSSGSGTVTSVAASVPSIFSISGSPITTSGTLAMTYSGTALPVANGGTATTTAFTAGSAVFAGASGTYSQANANFFWDNTNKRLGVGTATPTAPIDATGPAAPGTITSTGTAVTGSSTTFTTTFAVNDYIIAEIADTTKQTNVAQITSITDNTHLTLVSAFATDAPASTPYLRIGQNISSGGMVINGTVPKSALTVLAPNGYDGITVSGLYSTFIRLDGTDSNAGRRNWELITEANALGGLSLVVSPSRGAVPTTEDVTWNSDKTIVMKGYISCTALTTDSSGKMGCTASDENLKNIDGKFTRGLSELKNIEPINYHWNEKSGLSVKDPQTGFSAQNVVKTIPEAAFIGPDGYYRFNEHAVVATLVNAVKELLAKVEKLEAEKANH